MGWLLLLGSTGVAISTLLVSSLIARHYGYRIGVNIAVLLVSITATAAVAGSSAGAQLLSRTVERRRVLVPLAAFGGLAVYIGCVFVAEKLAGLL